MMMIKSGKAFLQVPATMAMRGCICLQTHIPLQVNLWQLEDVLMKKSEELNRSGERFSLKWSGLIGMELQ